MIFHRKYPHAMGRNVTKMASKLKLHIYFSLSKLTNVSFANGFVVDALLMLV